MIKAVILLTFFISQKSLALEWDAHLASQKASVEKIRAQEKVIYDLIEQKKSTKDNDKISKILEELVKEHNKLSELYDEFEKEKYHIKYEHPEEGSTIERRYSPYKLKTLQEFESEGGIDGRLSQIKPRVLKKYGDPIPPETKEKSEKKEQKEKQKPKKEEKPKEDDHPKLSF